MAETIEAQRDRVRRKQAIIDAAPLPIQCETLTCDCVDGCKREAARREIAAINSE